MKAAIIMPVYNPDQKMIDFLDSLISAGFQDIIVVNDGSKEELHHYFEEAAEHSEVTLLDHKINGGKGKALKSAFAYLAEREDDIDGAVTVDGDGQHDVISIKTCLAEYEKDTNAVIIGGRDFKKANIPARSKFGNRVSSVIYRFAVGIKLKDTQTGLRVIPKQYFKAFSELKGDRYEYETNMLIAISNMKIPYQEVPISTIYIDDNESSHFNPIKDSVKIYLVVLKYFFTFMISSLSSWVIDIGIYALFMAILTNRIDSQTRILICTVASRVISSFANYMFNKHGVFKSTAGAKSTLIKYYILAACQMLISYALVFLFANVFKIGGSVLEVVLKCVVDLLLFIFSYQIQHRLIFVDRKNNLSGKSKDNY